MSNSAENQTESKAPEKKEGMPTRQKVRLIVTTVLVLLLISFIIQNFNKVKVEFLMFEFRIRIVTIILVSAIIGGLITFLLMKHRNAKKRK